MKRALKRFRPSMTTSLLVVLLAFMVCAFGTIYVFQIYMLEDFYELNIFNNINSIASNIEAEIRLGNDDFDALADEYALVDDNICVLIAEYYDDGGLTIHVSQTDGLACTLYYLSDGQIISLHEDTAEAGGNANYQIENLLRIGREHTGIIRMAMHNMSMADGEYAVMVSFNTQSLISVTGTIQAQFLFVIGFVAVFVFVLALFFSIIFVKPLKKINEEAKSLPEGVYDGNEIKTNIQEMYDINETLKESCVAIKQADIARKELLSNVSHDLRTPLTMIVGYGEMMIDFDEEKNDDNITLIIDEAKRLSNLVNDLLDLSKAELGRLDLDIREVELNTFLTSVYNQYRVYLENQNIKFDIELDKDITCAIDDARMRQVLYNFINNAMNYNDSPEAVIKLSSVYEGGACIVSVYDNGKGIAPEDLEKIWDRYYKVDKEHKRQVIGSGIGLSLAKMILEAHDIEYGVESELGEYSRFWFKVRAIPKDVQQ